MNTVTTDVLTRLKEAYCIAVKEGRITFEFEGKELVTDFVKDLIEYLDYKLE
jgi:hypothetical protein